MFRTSLMIALVTAATVGAAGCNGARSSQANATAPGMASNNGDGLRMLHNVADPNAPFAVLSTTPHLAQREPLLDVNAVPVCDPSQLKVWESSASANGAHRSLRYTLSNTGAACKLAGFPAVTLLGVDGGVLGAIRVQKVSQNAIVASVQPGAPVAVSDDALSAPSAPVLLIPKGQAGFYIGWTSGPTCRQIGKIVIAAPGSAQSVIIPRQLSVCESRLMISAVSPNNQGN